MSHCETCQTDLSALLDGELETERQIVTVDHLVECRRCRAFYRQARALGGVLAAVSKAPGRESLPPLAWRRIARRAGLIGFGDWWRGSMPAQVAAAVAALFLAVGAFWLLSSGIGPTGQPEPQSDGPPQFDEVVIGGRAGEMSERRFIALARELLEADRRYRQEIVELMTAVESEIETERTTEEAAGDGASSRPPQRWDGYEGEGRDESDIRLRLW